MILNATEFINQIDPLVYEILVEISRRGYVLTLVGGAPREYLTHKKLPLDLDIEIKHLFEFREDQWERKLDDLFKNLATKFKLKYEKLNFLIYRLKAGNVELEFSSPRIEVNKSEDRGESRDKSHYYFTPQYISNLETKSAFRRRDLSINAIGIYLGVPGSDDEFKVIDPYDGVKDLSKKQLVPISEDFCLDYVRLLRLVRFQTILMFEIDKSFDKHLRKMSLEKCSSHYLKYEFFKCFNKEPSFKFFTNLWEVIKKYNIPTNEVVEATNVLSLISPDDSISKSSDFLHIIAFHKAVSDSDILELAKSFNLSLKNLKKHRSIFELINKANTLDGYLKLFDSLINYQQQEQIKFKYIEEVRQYKSKLAGLKYESKVKYQEDKKEILKEILSPSKVV